MTSKSPIYPEHGDFVRVAITGMWRKAVFTTLMKSHWADFLRRFTSEDQHQLFQEFRLQSREDADLEISDNWSAQWLFGISSFYSDFHHDSLTDSRPDFIPVQQSQSGGFPVPDEDFAEYDLKDYGLALFCQSTLSWTDTLDITMGLRYDFEHKEAGIDLLMLAAVSWPVGNISPDQRGSRPQHLFRLSIL